MALSAATNGHRIDCPTVLLTLRKMTADVVQRVMTAIEKNEIVEEADVVSILFKLMEVLYDECNLLKLHRPITVCGDIHGQFDDLLELFQRTTGRNCPPTDLRHQFLFLGDYVNRGHHSLNTFLYLGCLKIRHRESFFLLRGNHESRQVSHLYGLYQETLLNYGHVQIWTICNEVFDLLPMAAIIDLRLFAVHGGLSPELPYAYMINVLDRQMDVPQEGPLTDLCWSDPEPVQHWREGQRGAGHLFGPEQTRNFLQQNKLRLVARSHQLAMDGFQWQFPLGGDWKKWGTRIINVGGNASETVQDGYLVTIWSAPNYTYKSGNLASVLNYGFSDKSILELKKFNSNKTRIVPTDLAITSHYFS
jgi:diadenosine tetraphosphatase ApaH/serine/threonine PP2A family protein phosphatase